MASNCEVLGDPPVAFGDPHALKVRVEGTLRCRRPEETLDLIVPHMQAMGITRVANVTGLDRIGIPVFMVVRPNGRGLAVSQGKGIDVVCARVSGIMESMETHHAEYTTCEIVQSSYEGLIRKGSLVFDPMQLPMTRDSRYAPDFEVAWTEGQDLFTQERILLPYELVHANFTYPPPSGGECFLKTTNGLASGNSLVEATLHATCELIERDALAIWEAKPGEPDLRARLDLTTVHDPVCLDLLRRFDRADMCVLVWDVTSDVGVAAFRAIVFDRSGDALLYPMPAALGSGCHPAREIALSRALTEAAQSRLTFITGSRDDMTRFGRAESVKAFEHYSGVSNSEAEGVSFDASPTYSGATIEADLAHVLRRLRSVGADRVAMVDLSRRHMPISVVRVLASSLEGMSEFSTYCRGPRARAARSA